MAATGGDIRRLRRCRPFCKPQLPMIAINTSGSKSEMTRFCIITDEVRHIKMARLWVRTRYAAAVG
ncbi:hypothetical protein ACNKHK_23255 [Shigella flexneri]